LKDLRIVNNIAIHRKTISMNAKNGDLRPKNITDQKIFKPSWIANQNIATLTLRSLKVFSHKRKREMPISTNKLIQTGEKTQLGGLKAGFLRLAYHVGIAGEVNKDPTNPVN